MDSTLALGALRIARGAGGEGVDVNGNLVEREKGDEFGIKLLLPHAPGRLPTRPLCRKIQPNVLRCNRLARGGPPGDIIPGNCRTEGEAGFYSLTPRTPTRR